MSKDLTEKNFKKLIQKHIDKIDFVRITLENNFYISGFIVKLSDDFVMIEETYDFSMCGIKIIPYERLKSIRHNKFDNVSKNIYREEDLIKLNYKIIDNTSLKNFESLFKSIKKQNFHCIVESTKKGDNVFSIGEILDFNKKSVVIKNYDATGKINKKPHKIRFKNIELVTFNDNYSIIFRKYLTQ